LLVLAGFGLCGFGAADCYDPVHDREVAALGGEAPGVSPGPDHRPGQPCNVCHGGIGPATLRFSLAGTVYTYIYDTSQPASSAQITIQDATGSQWHTTSTGSGNFFVLQDNWSPTYPITVPSILDSSGNPKANPAQMTTLDNRDGSCADCHGQTPSTTSVGPVYIYRTLPDGGRF
jgi:hypothetical protein